MQAQAEYITEAPLPAVATLFAGMRATDCACCQGTGEEGRTETPVRIGEGTVFLTATRWCKACRGTGMIFKLEGRIKNEESGDSRHE